ncbi:MAG: peptidyl-prolyl cis-trans isomerase [Chthoniobacteraceae bacterium]
MVHLMRKYQQSLMVFVTVIVIICFTWFYNTTSGRADHSDADIAGKVYGRTVNGGEFNRMRRKLEIAQGLRLLDLLRGLTSVGNANPAIRESPEETYIWNSFVLRHEADALGIVPTNEEIIEAVKRLPSFSTNGVYDSTKYTQFVQLALSPRGLSTEMLEELVGDSLRLEKIKALLGATDKASLGEIRAMYERRNQKTDASVIRLKLDEFRKDVKISDEDVQKRFEEKKATLQHLEKRKVKVVAFTPPPSTPPLAGKERVMAMQKLADTAIELTVAMTEKDAKLDEAAAKVGATVVETPEFEASAPPKEIGSAPDAAVAAFKLTNEDPNSDVVTTDGGYYVLQLAGITPAKPMTLEEAKAQLTEELTSERANEALSLKGAELRKKITEALAAGKSFADAAKEAGATVDVFPTFSPAEQPKADQPDAREIMGRSFEMNEGELSDFSPTGTGGLLIHIDKRLPVDESGFEKEKTMIANSLEETRKMAALQQWLKERRIAAGFVEAKG